MLDVVKGKHVLSGCCGCNWSKPRIVRAGGYLVVIAQWCQSTGSSSHGSWAWFPYNTVSNMYWVHVCEILHCKGQFGTFVTLTWYTDVDSRQLVDAWLVCSISQEPGVSRAFQITLPVGGNTPTQKVAIEHFSSWVSIYSHGRKTENGDLGLTWYGKGCYERVIVNYKSVSGAIECMCVSLQ